MLMGEIVLPENVVLEQRPEAGEVPPRQTQGEEGSRGHSG